MYDAIIVGARCAGASTALLLARKGYKVLLLDRGSFPSDMAFSNHFVHQTGTARLKRWGLLDKLAATGCPAITTDYFDYGAFTLSGSPPPAEGGMREAYAPRRKVLDPILVEAAVEAGAELRENFSVQEVLWENDRVTGIRGHGKNSAMVTENARITIGADGMFSTVAKAVKAPEYNNKPPLEGSWYSYWSGLRMMGWHLWLRPHRVIFAYSTNDNLTLVGSAFAARDLPVVRADIEGHYMSAVAQCAPDLFEQMRSCHRESKFVGGAIPGYLRKPYGPGWALVGDAGYQKDPCTASGITDAFRSAELLAEAIDAGLSGRQAIEQALAGYEQQRNQTALPFYELTSQLATLEPPSPEMQQLLAALRENPEQARRFFGVFALTVPVPEFFASENVQQILAGNRRQAAARKIIPARASIH
ncbi:MAG TPA: NAD(P)/FAD-dependent oxidoreductase [Terriglobales bacterium]|jgi:flavin-dependent dehydrogenase|nr:NAD(P)/FAD-dependent oxidoreductase [Terriglobales bacterium]